MTRRTLEEGLAGGLTDNVSEEARKFVHGESTDSVPSSTTKIDDGKTILPQMTGRHALTIKLDPQVASDLKRLSLQRQLDGIEPRTMQDMAEEAIIAWLAKHK